MIAEAQPAPRAVARTPVEDFSVGDVYVQSLVPSRTAGRSARTSALRSRKLSGVRTEVETPLWDVAGRRHRGCRGGQPAMPAGAAASASKCSVNHWAAAPAARARSLRSL